MELLTPPLQTPYLDVVTFRFAFVDAGRDFRIIGITGSDIDAWGEGTPISSANFVLTPIGDFYEFAVNSTVLAGVLVSDYNLTLVVDINNAVVPYHLDASTRVSVTIVERFMTYSPAPIDPATFGDNLTIQFDLSDSTRGWPVTGVDIAFDGQTVSLVEDVDFWITRGSGASAGHYIIDVNTSALGGPGDAIFDLDVTWTAGAPYYADLPTIAITGFVQDIETTLETDDQVIQGPWQGTAFVQVRFRNLYNGSLIPDANVKWIWPAADGHNGTLSDPL